MTSIYAGNFYVHIDNKNTINVRFIDVNGYVRVYHEYSVSETDNGTCVSLNDGYYEYNVYPFYCCCKKTW